MNERRSGMKSRVTELEIKLSLAEDQIEELNRTVFRQQQKMELLQAQIRELYQLQQPEAANEPRSLRDEIPPHY
jgi:SlyX protein